MTERRIPYKGMPKTRWAPPAPQLIKDARMLIVGYKANPDALAAVLPPGLQPHPNGLVQMNMYEVEARQTSGFGAFSLTYLTVEIDGHDSLAADGTVAIPGRFFAYYWNSSPRVRTYAREAAGIPAMPGTRRSEVSDGTLIPGNAGLSAEARAQRIATVFRPYHAAIATELDRLNGERRTIERLVCEQAEALAPEQPDAPVITVMSSGWHQGVIGIVAGLLTLPLRFICRFPRLLLVRLPALCDAEVPLKFPGARLSVTGPKRRVLVFENAGTEENRLHRNRLPGTLGDELLYVSCDVHIATPHLDPSDCRAFGHLPHGAVARWLLYRVSEPCRRNGHAVLWMGCATRGREA